jgi:hypothetical protein
MKMICSPLPVSLPPWIDPAPLTVVFGLPPRDPNDDDDEEEQEDDEEDEDLEPPVVREPEPDE